MKATTSILVAVVLAAPGAAGAQSVTLGVKVGLDHAAWTGNFGTPTNPFGPRTGPVGGASIAVGLREILSIQLEALYSRKGASGPGDFQMDIGYLETPILLKLAVPIAGLPVRPVVMAGIAPAWEISCAAAAQPLSLLDAPPPPAVPADCIGWRTERRDFGRVVAGGVEMPVGRLRLTAELRHTTGRTNIALGYAPLSTYNDAWSFLLGTAFAL